MRLCDERALWLARQVLPHEPALRAWLQSRRVPGLEVDDIVQETYARLCAVEHVHHIRDPKTYTFQIAHSVIVTFVRHSRIVPIQVVDQLDAFAAMDAPDPESHTADREELQRLAEAIAALPGKIRDVFVLRRIHALSQREVAMRVGLSESTVEKHMKKAFEQLGAQFSRGGKPKRRASRSDGNRIHQIHGRRDKPRD